MKPAQLNLTIYRGQTWKKRLSFRVNGDVISLVNHQFKAEIRPVLNSPILTDEFTIRVIPEQGVVELSLTDEQTSNLSGTLVWDLKSEDGNNIVNYWVFGNITISGRVTV